MCSGQPNALFRLRLSCCMWFDRSYTHSQAEYKAPNMGYNNGKLSPVHPDCACQSRRQLLGLYCHEQVMHMSLKASNVFLTKTYSIAKIGEVDMAQVMGSTTPQRPHAATFAYSAPELILNSPCSEKVRAFVFTNAEA